MEKKISLWVILGLIGILLAVFTYIIYKDLNNKKDHLRKMMINRGDAILDSFEAASRQISRSDHRREFWIQKLLVETSRIPAVKFIFISSPKGEILARSNILKTDHEELQNLAKSKKAQKNILWETIKKENKETLVLFRKLSPAFLPDNGHWKQPKGKPGAIKKMHPKMKQMHRFKMEKGPVIRFFYRNNEILHYNPKDLSIFLALDMEMVYKSKFNNEKETIYSGIMLFALSSAAILLLFFINNYRAAKISLGRAKRFSGAIIEAMPTGFISTNFDGEVLYFNKAAESIFENHENTTTLPGEIKKIITKIDRSKLSKKSLNKEITINTDSTPKNLDLNISYTTSGGDEKPGLLILIKDETEKNALKNEIALNERLATVGRLAAGVAHEIRNPLSSIKGFSTCITENPKDFNQSVNISRLIINEVDRLDKVVGQLLDFSKPLILIKEQIDLRDLIEETLNLLKHKAESEKIETKNLINKNIIIDIDKDKIKQVFLNILSNSLEAVGESGLIEVGCKKQNNKIVLKFIDSGPGIPGEIMKNIFEPYYTTKSTGTGLGLAISRNIIQAHKGRIFAKNNHENKTIFYIELPLEKNRQ